MASDAIEPTMCKEMRMFLENENDKIELSIYSNRAEEARSRFKEANERVVCAEASSAYAKSRLDGIKDTDPECCAERLAHAEHVSSAGLEVIAASALQLIAAKDSALADLRYSHCNHEFKKFVAEKWKNEVRELDCSVDELYEDSEDADAEVVRLVDATEEEKNDAETASEDALDWYWKEHKELGEACRMSADTASEAVYAEEELAVATRRAISLGVFYQWERLLTQ